MKLGDFVQTGDWKGEKHVPVIDAPEKASAGEAVKVDVCVGKEIAHPNTASHYIKWIKLLFVPDGGKFAIELANFAFDAHRDSADPEKPGPASTEPFVSFKVKLAASGTFVAQSYCNIHGLWENSRPIKID
jgi:superoxide reductase